jgi:hypothetical protein
MAKVGTIGAAFSQTGGTSWKDRNHDGVFKKHLRNTAIPGKKHIVYPIQSFNNIILLL